MTGGFVWRRNTAIAAIGITIDDGRIVAGVMLGYPAKVHMGRYPLLD